MKSIPFQDPLYALLSNQEMIFFLSADHENKSIQFPSNLNHFYPLEYHQNTSSWVDLENAIVFDWYWVLYGMLCWMFLHSDRLFLWMSLYLVQLHRCLCFSLIPGILRWVLPCLEHGQIEDNCHLFLEWEIEEIYEQGKLCCLS